MPVIYGVVDYAYIFLLGLIDELYDFSELQYEYYIREFDGETYLDVNVFTDMTLMRDPIESPFVLGMNEAISEETDAYKLEKMKNELELYLNYTEDYYLQPEFTTFTYSVLLDTNDEYTGKNISNSNFEVFYRNDLSDSIEIIPLYELSEIEDESSAKAEGYKLAKNVGENVEAKNVKASFRYDRLQARNWAWNNWNASPEFPSSTVGGTDCANFVSKALNAGGIPEDASGKWYRASSWGGWPGDNWLRTGYNNNGGVVPYMVNKGYFSKQSNESLVSAGSIMYWNNTSHVALVTYGDGTTIKYTQHGATQSKDTVYRSENASFYVPSSSIQ